MRFQTETVETDLEMPMPLRHLHEAHVMSSIRSNPTPPISNTVRSVLITEARPTISSIQSPEDHLSIKNDQRLPTRWFFAQHRICLIKGYEIQCYAPS